MWLLRQAGFCLSLFLIAAAYRSRHYVSVLTRGGELRGVRIILEQDRRVVLVAHWYAPWAWTLPGGGVDPGETAEQAVIREVREETGFHVRSIAGQLGTYAGPLNKGDRLSVYLSSDFDGTVAFKRNREIIACAWFGLDDLPAGLAPASRRRLDAYRAGVRGETGRW
jgi:8-oxo-dGTP pyrophosphatase MutT (NUDIX family)